MKYDQKTVKALAKNYKAEEADIRKREPAYGTVGVYKPIVNILINSVKELNLNKQDIYNAVNRGPNAVRTYINNHKDYIKNTIINQVRVLGNQMYGKFDKLLKLIEKYEKLTDKQEKTIDRQDKTIDKQDKKIDNLEAKIEKDAPLLKKARVYKAKADTLDACAQTAKGYHIPTTPKLSGHTMKYLRGK